MSTQTSNEHALVSSGWKPFGKNTYLVKMRKYLGAFQQYATSETRHGFVHFPCSRATNKAFGEGYGLYEENMCQVCGNVMPREARESEGYVTLMNAVQKLGG